MKRIHRALLVVACILIGNSAATRSFALGECTETDPSGAGHCHCAATALLTEAQCDKGSFQGHEVWTCKPASPFPGNRPVIVGLHGGFSSGLDFLANEGGCQMARLANADGQYAIFPDGTLVGQEDPIPDGLHWNDCRSSNEKTDPGNVDHVQYLQDLVDSATATNPSAPFTGFKGDPARVYVWGLSNGGIMTYRLATEMPKAGSTIRPAAFASIAAGQPKNSECSAPAQPAALLIMSGTADPIMPYGDNEPAPLCIRPNAAALPFCGSSQSCNGWNGSSNDDADEVLSVEPPGQSSTIRTWLQAGGCSTAAAPSPLTFANVVTSDQSTVDRFTYRGCANPDLELKLFRVNGGGHWLPQPDNTGAVQSFCSDNPPPPLPRGYLNRDIDGAGEVRDFFQPRRFFADWQECGSASCEWDAQTTANGGTLAIATSGSNKAMAVTLNGTANGQAYARETLATGAQDTFRASFWIDLGSLSIPANQDFVVFRGVSGSETRLELVLGKTATGARRMFARILEDNNTTWRSTSWIDLQATFPQQWEVRSRRSSVGASGSGNGYVCIKQIKNQAYACYTGGADNDTKTISGVQLGAISGVDAATSGTFYWDELEVFQP